MNMHGIMSPIDLDGGQETTFYQRVWAWMKAKYMFMLIVVAPTVLLGGYLFLFASDQYESEAHFLVRSQNVSETVPGIGVSQALTMMTGASAAQNEAMSVSDYLTSHDVVATLRREDKLVERFDRPGIDLISRLRSDNPTPERLLKYYRKQVEVKYNTETGITTLKVHSFTPQDSYELARKLLDLGEKRVNTLNARSLHDSLAMSRRQLAEAEDALAQAELKVTQFRQRRGDIDPKASGEAQLGLVSTLTGQLAGARAQLDQMRGSIDPSSPQLAAIKARVRSLEAQVAAQSGRLTGGNRAIANDISSYQGLLLRQQFLAKRYEAAAASLDKARDQALRQQLYLVRVVNPNMPVKSQFPERWRILSTLLVALLLTYSIGWLIAAGVREHAA